MRDKQEEIVRQITTKLHLSVKEIIAPPQGMDSHVFILVSENGKEYVVKVGGCSGTDIKAYKLIENNMLDVPCPFVYLTGFFEGVPFIVMEKIDHPLLEEVMTDGMGSYLPSIIETLSSIHSIKSKRSGPLEDEGYNGGWKEYHLSIFDGSDSSFNWEEIAKRDCLDRGLVLESVERYNCQFSKLNYQEGEYSLLHNDYNQRNIFIDLGNKKVGGIIDWGDAIFGDPIYDFSRVRMLLWHYNFGKDVVENYYKLMRYQPEERRMDDLYWVSRVIEYLAYYSRKLDNFSIPRIKLHEDFLRNLDWENL